MALMLQDFGVCKYCRGMVQVMIEDGDIQDVLHAPPAGKDCAGPDAVGPDGSRIFIDGVCGACPQPNTFRWRDGEGFRKLVGHNHPDLDRRCKERAAAGEALEDIYPGIFFPASDRPDLLDAYFEANPDKED